MKLTRAGQFINVDSREIENVLDFDNGKFSLVITNQQYQQVLDFLRDEVPEEGYEEIKQSFYVNQDQIKSLPKIAHDEEDGIDQL